MHLEDQPVESPLGSPLRDPCAGEDTSCRIGELCQAYDTVAWFCFFLTNQIRMLLMTMPSTANPVMVMNTLR